MDLKIEAFRRFIESEAKPRWENKDEAWSLRPGGGETYVQDNVLKKAGPYLTQENIQSDIRQNLIKALSSHVNLLNRFEYSFARKFIEIKDETSLRRKFSTLLYDNQTPLKERLSDVLSWAKVEETDEKGKKSGINATVFSYLLAMTDPKEYPYCKPVAYNAVVDTLFSKIERCSDPIDRILHCQTIYKELLHILENEYGLYDGNLLDIHSLGYLLAHSKKESKNNDKPGSIDDFKQLQKIDGQEPIESKNFWWFNSNPKIWNFFGHQVGESLSYTSINSKGNKRRIYSHFTEVKPGDLMYCYVSSPVKEVSGLCKITEPLHETENGEAIEFEILEQYENGLKWADLKSAPELRECEPLMNNQGSLFKLNKDEFENIQAMVDELNPVDS